MKNFEENLKTYCSQLPKYKLKTSLWGKIEGKLDKKPVLIKTPVLIFSLVACVVLILITLPMKPKQNLSVDCSEKPSMYEYPKNSIFAVLEYQANEEKYGKSSL